MLVVVLLARKVLNMFSQTPFQIIFSFAVHVAGRAYEFITLVFSRSRPLRGGSCGKQNASLLFVWRHCEYRLENANNGHA